MFTNAKIGDRVWNFLAGWGTITDINDGIITVDYDDRYQGCETFYFTGKKDKKDKNPSFFWAEIKYAMPTPNLRVDTKVEVWNTNEEVRKNRYFSHFDDSGKINCFWDGATSWSNSRGTSAWENWQLADKVNERKRDYIHDFIFTSEDN